MLNAHTHERTHMIKKIPKILQFPNYEIDVEEIDDDMFFGSFSNRELKLTISNNMEKRQDFDKYTLCLFTAAAIFGSTELKVNNAKLHTLGGFLFFLLHKNNMKKLCNGLISNRIKSGFIEVPSFGLYYKIRPPEAAEELDGYISQTSSPAGFLMPVHQIISISSESSIKLRPVILCHELVEWWSFYYGIDVPHSNIQIISEYLAYIIMNNTFIT